MILSLVEWEKKHVELFLSEQKFPLSTPTCNNIHDSLHSWILMLSLISLFVLGSWFLSSCSLHFYHFHHWIPLLRYYGHFSHLVACSLGSCPQPHLSCTTCGPGPFVRDFAISSDSKEASNYVRFICRANRPSLGDTNHPWDKTESLSEEMCSKGADV